MDFIQRICQPCLSVTARALMVKLGPDTEAVAESIWSLTFSHV